MSDTKKQTVTKTLVVVMEVPLSDKEAIEADWEKCQSEGINVKGFLEWWSEFEVEARLR